MILERISAMLATCSAPNGVLPPTELYNEGWMLRLIIDWRFRTSTGYNDFFLTNRGRWYAEALLPSAFLPRYRGDKLGESWTHADAVVGEFEIGSTGKGDLSLTPEAHNLTVIEAKMFSRLSPGVTHAPYYDQASRTVACMAEVLSRAGIAPNQMLSLGFYLLAPEEQVQAGVFSSTMDVGSIRQIVERRVREYGTARNDWFDSSFLPTTEKIRIAIVTWEEAISGILKADDTFGQALEDFYRKCLEVGRFGERTKPS